MKDPDAGKDWEQEDKGPEEDRMAENPGQSHEERRPQAKLSLTCAPGIFENCI